MQEVWHGSHWTAEPVQLRSLLCQWQQGMPLDGHESTCSKQAPLQAWWLRQATDSSAHMGLQPQPCETPSCSKGATGKGLQDGSSGLSPGKTLNSHRLGHSAPGSLGPLQLSIHDGQLLLEGQP